MAQHQSRSEIIVGGRTDSTFFQMVGNLNDFGMQLTHLTDGLRQFGSDALEVYRKYEDGMLETRSVLYKQYSSGELNKVMSELEKNAQKWAQTTIFHTDDVANAMAEAAHAGWDYEKILKGIPSAMLIAQAGGLELSDSVDMLAKMLAATGTAFSDSGKFIDQWARSSDLVATDIGEMGDAFLRLGAAAQFTDSNEELFTMLAVLAQVGTTGSNAGTAVRNMMIRLIAPTEKAAAAMEELGISDDEVAEAFEGLDEASAAAYERLKEFGFDPYDEHGNLKGFIQIFTDLNAAIEELPDEQEQNKILAAIFPTRTLSYAKAMLAAVQDGSIFSIYDAIYGDSEGYAQGKSDILMSGITGDLEILASKWEETKRRIGESMSMDVSWGAAFLGNLLDKINNMDPILLDALVGAFEALAVAGPMLTVGAGAFSKLGALAMSHPYVTAFILAAVGVTALAKALGELEQRTFENQFGEMDLDTDALLTYVDTVNEKFTSAYASVNTYKTALDEATTKYQEASSALSGKLTTAVITGSELTKEDIEQLKGLGQRMGTELINGINAAFDESTEYRLALLGEDAFNDPTMAAVAISMKRLKDDMVSAAGSLGDELGAAMDAAFEDGIVTGEELNIIRRKMDAYNQAMAEVRGIEERAEVIAQLHKAQSVSWDSYADFMTQSNAKFDQTEAELEDNYVRMYARDQAYMEALINGGYKNEATGKPWTEADMNAALLEYENAHKEEMAKLAAERREVGDAAFEALIQGTEGYDIFKELEKIYNLGYWEDGQSPHGKDRWQQIDDYINYLNKPFLEGDVKDFEAAEKQNETFLDTANFIWGILKYGDGILEESKRTELENLYRWLKDVYDTRANGLNDAQQDSWYDPYEDQKKSEEYGRELVEWPSGEEVADAILEPIYDFFFGTLASAEEYTEEELAAMQDEFSEKYGKSKDIWKAFGIVARLPKTENTAEAEAAAEEILENAGLADTPLADALMGVNFEGEAKFADALSDFRQMMEAEEYAEEQMAEMQDEYSKVYRKSKGIWKTFRIRPQETEEYAEEEIARIVHMYTGEELAAMQAEYAEKYGKANGIWAMFGTMAGRARNRHVYTSEELEAMQAEYGEKYGKSRSIWEAYVREALLPNMKNTAEAEQAAEEILENAGLADTPLADALMGVNFAGEAKFADALADFRQMMEAEEYAEEQMAEMQDEYSKGYRKSKGIWKTFRIRPPEAEEYAEEQMEEMQAAADAGIEVELLPTPDGKETAQVFIEDAQAMLTSKPGKWQITPIMMGGSGGRGGGGGGLGTLFGDAGGGGIMFLPSTLQYAEGGRATTASIFGESGAEWAIPEEHSQRTAALLDAARKASGFTWGEILAAYGGLNAGSGSGGQMIYSPTIYANDARGVKEALAADKARFEKWWKDKERRDSLEVYA